MDRTMVRIGWMNLILHGIENPKIERRDALSKSLPDNESNSYRYILANPPYSGNIDKGDIHKTRFPKNPKKKKIKGTDEIEPISDKTELLFIWLILDLLEVGGKAAVIVPEGLLFGSSIAHKELRKELLLEHKLHAVISLPGGVFEPYSGVKTSIIYFEKSEKRTSKLDAPKTALEKLEVKVYRDKFGQSQLGDIIDVDGMPSRRLAKLLSVFKLNGRWASKLQVNRKTIIEAIVDEGIGFQGLIKRYNLTSIDIKAELEASLLRKVKSRKEGLGKFSGYILQGSYLNCALSDTDEFDELYKYYIE